MIYFDYSATTPVRDEVLDTFVEVTKKFPFNPNSLHQLGSASKKLMISATEQVANLLGVKEKEVIFTSSASEANNMAIKGVLAFYPKRKPLIITTALEHASILETVRQLEKVDIAYVKLDDKGHIDQDDLQRLLALEPILVSIHHVNSELGIIQDIAALGKLIKQYPKVIFHVDGTQSVGKIPCDLTEVDLFSFSAHKFFGLKGIACLIKKEKIGLFPLIHGGASQSPYRAGTPSVALICSLAKALRLILLEQQANYQHVLQLQQMLREELKDIKGLVINSPDDSSPYLFNFSLCGQKPETVLRKLEAFEIYVSTKTACSSKDDYSKAVYAVTKDLERAKSSLRLSLSKLNTKDEVKTLIKVLKEEILTWNE